MVNSKEVRTNKPSAGAQSPLQLTISLFFRSLTIRLGCIITLVHDQVLKPIILLATEVALQDALGAFGVALLSVERRARHVWDHRVAATEGVLGVAQRVLCWCWLWEPNIATVATQVARLEGFGNIFFDDDGAAGGVDQPGAWTVRSVK